MNVICWSSVNYTIVLILYTTNILYCNVIDATKTNRVEIHQLINWGTIGKFGGRFKREKFVDETECKIHGAFLAKAGWACSSQPILVLTR